MQLCACALEHYSELQERLISDSPRMTMSGTEVVCLSIASCQWPVAATATAKAAAATAHPSLPHDCVRTALSSFPLSNVHSYSVLVARCSLQAVATAASQPPFIGVVATIAECQMPSTTITTTQAAPAAAQIITF